MNSSYLVNIVANDFKDGASIFEPFQLDVVDTKQANGAAHGAHGANGVLDTVRNAANGLLEQANGAVAALSHTIAPNGH